MQHPRGNIFLWAYKLVFTKNRPPVKTRQPFCLRYTFETEIDRDHTITKQVCFERSNGPGGCREKGLQGTVFRVTFSHAQIFTS